MMLANFNSIRDTWVVGSDSPRNKVVVVVGDCLRPKHVIVTK